MPDDSRLSGDDLVWGGSPPEWLPTPLRRVAGDLTYAEAHAMLLGLVGTLAGAGWFFGWRSAAQAFTVAVTTLAFGLRAAPNDLPIAGRLVRREPWYFFVVYIASLTAAYWLLVVIL